MMQGIIQYCLAGGDPRRAEVRSRCGTLAGKVGIGANLLLFAAKLLSGLFTN